MNQLFETRAAYLFLLPLLLVLTALILSDVDRQKDVYVFIIYSYSCLLMTSMIFTFYYKNHHLTFNTQQILVVALILLSFISSFFTLKFALTISFFVVLLLKRNEESYLSSDNNNPLSFEIRQKLYYSTATVLLLSWIITQ